LSLLQNQEEGAMLSRIICNNSKCAKPPRKHVA
jgi:hypothetical protein